MVYSPPVNAPISDPFRAPAGPYGPGNRGIEYATAVGQVVAASADGTVEFAGQVALANHVVIRHADGLRTSYSFLASIRVTRGQAVRRGTVIGTAGRVTHFGVRTPDGLYLDPALLFARVVISARLAKTDAMTTVEVNNEQVLADFMVQRLAAQLAESGVVGSLNAMAGDLWAGLEWLADQAVKLGGNIFSKLELTIGFIATLAQLQRRLITNFAINFAQWVKRECTDALVPLAGVKDPAHRVVILVGGLTTGTRPNGTLDSGLENLNLAELGYDATRVVRFSYRGGRTPGTTAPIFTQIPTNTYESADTEQSAYVSADRLADLVRQVHTADPTASIDIMGHSLGGLISQAVANRNDMPTLDHVVLFGAPVHGAELAGIGAAIDSYPRGGAGGDGVADHFGLPHATSAVIGDLVPGSEFIAMVAAGIESSTAPHPRTISIAAAGDLVVPAYRSHVEGAINVIEPIIRSSAHGDLPGTREALVDVSRAMNSQAPACQSFVQATVVDTMGPTLVGSIENSIGLVAVPP